MMLANKLMGGVTAGEDAAEGVDFDGVNDYLSRSTDLVGNADGKTFTFMTWMYIPATSVYTSVYMSTTGLDTGFQVWFNAQGKIQIFGKASNGSTVIDATVNTGFPLNTFIPLLLSIDLQFDNRKVFFGDVQVTDITWSTFSIGAIIDFTKSNHSICANTAGGEKALSRLAHVFLDYTYRDLSVEANRRLFITADRKPANMATLKALNPILYLPMTDPSTVHINEGTGGNFTLNGVIARSGRGPNQFNAPYSDLDGSADYLSRTTALNGATAGNAFTFACCFNWDGTSGQKLFEIAAPPNVRFQVAMDGGSPSKLVIAGETSAGVAGINASLITSTIAVGRNYVLVVSCDLSNTANRHITLNGVAQSVTWTTYTNVSIAFNSSNQYVGAQNGGISLWNGRLGNVFFDTRYIDLSNPDNLAKFVTGTGIDAKPADLGANGELPFGTPPLIYLPMYGDNAWKNYGTGGDFTVNSGPYPGARGPNEYWGNKAVFDGGTGYLSRSSALVGIAASKTFSCAFTWSPVVEQTGTVFSVALPGGIGFRIEIIDAGTSNNQLRIQANNSGGTTILDAQSTGSMPTNVGQSFNIFISIDLANTANRYIEASGTGVTWTTYTNDTIPFNNANVGIGVTFFSGTSTSSFLNSKLSEFYFTTSYIDFSQEANRLKFRDAFGSPVALLPQIEAGTLPNPAIYMRFDPANFGKNLGTGGDFTINGTITDGGQL